MDLRQLALGALCIADPVRKAYAVQALRAQAETLPLDPDAVLAEPADLPGRPVRPVLVRADGVPPRSPFTLEGRAALMHAIAHIEFNAIKTAFNVWDDLLHAGAEQRQLLLSLIISGCQAKSHT